MKVIGIIPSRYKSTRFPGKPLVDILGKSMIQRVYELCKKCTSLSEIIVATDDKRILNHVIKFGGQAIITDASHKSGTDRCNEVIQKINKNYDVIINIQGDEPYINPLQIKEIINLFKNENVQIGTLVKKIDNLNDIDNKNTVKTLLDQNLNALNFSRKITNFSTNYSYYKHIGIYGFKKEILSEICQLKQSENELREKLEQLRWIDNNYKIKVGITDFDSISVDSKEDLEKIKQRMR